MVRYRTVAVGDHRIFYREAGDPNQTSLLLLYGFPSSWRGLPILDWLRFR
jgi:pimeloyl-ACP methyl ester carboxylesterase